MPSAFSTTTWPPTMAGPIAASECSPPTAPGTCPLLARQREPESLESQSSAVSIVATALGWLHGPHRRRKSVPLELRMEFLRPTRLRCATGARLWLAWERWPDLRPVAERLRAVSVGSARLHAGRDESVPASGSCDLLRGMQPIRQRRDDARRDHYPARQSGVRALRGSGPVCADRPLRVRCQRRRGLGWPVRDHPP